MNTLIKEIIEREGGFVNRPNDRGGATNYGITIQSLSDWRKTNCTVSDVENLSIEEAGEIYTSIYLIKSGVNNIKDENLKTLVLDFAVNSGVTRSIKFLQELVKVNPDGIAGSITIQSVNNFPDQKLLRKQFLAKRISFLGELIKNKPSQAEFAHGWMNRIGKLLIEFI